MLNFEINRFDDYNEVIENILDENSSKIILFNGDLGSGKTTLIQLICKKLKIKEKVLSPTFNLINEYQINNDFKVYHFDLYRIKSIQELIEIDFIDYIYSCFSSCRYYFYSIIIKHINAVCCNCWFTN